MTGRLFRSGQLQPGTSRGGRYFRRPLRGRDCFLLVTQPFVTAAEKDPRTRLLWLQLGSL
jgi:hypothetical protein